MSQLLKNYPLPEIHWEDQDLSKTLKKYVIEQQQILDKLIEAKRPARDAIAWRTAAIDRLLKELFQQTRESLSVDGNGSHPYAIVAQGGYGRSELSYHSDIDILFLHDSPSSDKLKSHVDKILYPLWDSGLDLGYAVRNEKECLRLMKDDLTILTSLIDARYLAGDKNYYDKFQKNFWRSFESDRFLTVFIKKKEREQSDRGHKFGGSVFLLEPNVKEGRGGLRDYHHIHWIVKSAFRTAELSSLVEESWIKPEELKNLQSAVEFLWAVRNELHRRSKRKTDQLLFEYQAPIAEWLGYKDTEKILGVEDFMRTCYQHAAECFRISQKVNRKFMESKKRSRLLSFRKPKRKKVDAYFEIENSFLVLNDPDAFKVDRSNLIRIFRIMQQTGTPLGRTVKEAVRDCLHFIDEDFQKDPVHTALFREILSEPESSVPPLMAMHELGVLERFMPEFGNLMYRVQHDIYHVYTVDIHSIRAVGEFGKLIDGFYEEQFPTPTEVARTAPKRDLLAFAIMYHDIGKGEGSGHVAKGAPLVRQAGVRLGFTPDEVDQAVFLELSHLLMTHLAFRRDVDDPNLIQQFAQSMTTEENLGLLYVLTFCDVKAVSREALTKWKESLLEYLFMRTRSVLRKGDFGKEKLEEIKATLHENVTILASNEFSEQEIKNFFEIMPPRYFMNASAVTILDHLNMMRQSKESPTIFQHRDLEKEGLNEWTILTIDTPGLFSKVCGILASNGVSISEAYLNTSTDGHDLYIFKLLTAQGRMIDNDSKWEKIESDTRQVLSGQVALEKLLGDRLKPSLLHPKTARRFPSKVLIDNDVSPFYSVIDIYAHDRVGLLYQITSTLESLGLYVDLSKIATKVDQVTDTFYVRDIFGQKLRSEDRIKKIRQTLLAVIDGENEQDVA